MSADSEDRKVIRIAISSAAKEAVENFAEEFDMKEIGVASRMYEWFGRQPKDVQKWVLGLVSGKESIGMRMFADQLLDAAPPSAAPKLPTGSPVAHVKNGRNATDQIHDAAYGDATLRGEGKPSKKKRED